MVAPETEVISFRRLAVWDWVVQAVVGVKFSQTQPLFAKSSRQPRVISGGRPQAAAAPSE